MSLLLVASNCALPEPPPLTAHIVARSFPLSFDPHHRNEVVTISVLRNVYEGLTEFGNLGRIQPLLAESWSNPDDKTWRIRLRDGVRFHDGSLLDVDDVIFSLRRAASHPQTEYASLIVEIAEVEALDSLTVEIRTRQPNPVILNKLAFIMILPDETPDEIVQPLGTGPFRWESSVAEQEVVLVRNESYWRQPASVERVVIETVGDATERLRRMQMAAESSARPSDSPHIVQDLDPFAIADLKLPGFQIVRRSGADIEYLALDARIPPFDDHRVRQAIDLAIDREGLVRDHLNGSGLALHQMMPPGLFGFIPDISPLPHDPERSRRLLEDAGYPEGIDLEVVFREGRSFEVLGRQLASAGIRVQTVRRPWAEVFEAISAREIPFYLGGIVAVSGDASDILDSMLHSPTAGTGYGKLNSAFYRNPEVDQWIEAAGATLDTSTRRQRIARALEISRDDHVYLPLYTTLDLYALADGWSWDPQPGLNFDAYRLRPPER